jgi:hypothetical protein
MGSVLDNKGNLISFINRVKPAYFISPSEQVKLFGNS